MEPNKSKPFVEQFDTIIAFLSLELLALTAFGLGGALGMKIFSILGFFLAFFTVPFIRLNFSKADVKLNLKYFIPLGLLAVLLGFSGFYLRYYGGFNLSFLLYSLLETMGLIGFFILGFALKSISPVKKNYILLALLGGLALYCLIVGFYSLIRYGPFYVTRFDKMNYYYQGVFFPVYREGKALVGFSFVEASLSFASISAFILSCSGVGLFGLSPKAHPRRFFMILGFAALGLLYLVLMPHIKALVLLVAVYAFFGVVYFFKWLATKNERTKKGVDKTASVFYIAFIVITVIVVFMLITEGELGLVSKLCNAVLHRVPGVIDTALDAVKDAVYNGSVNADLHRIDIASLLFGYAPSGTLTVHFTRFLPINMLWQNGLVALGLAIFAFFLILRRGRKFLVLGQEDTSFRLVICALALGTLVYACFFSDEMPLVHGDEFLPFTQSGWMLILSALCGIIYASSIETKEVVAHE